VVEGTPLLRVHLGKTWIQGSNPCVSARNNDKTRTAKGFAGFSFHPTHIITHAMMDIRERISLTAQSRRLHQKQKALRRHSCFSSPAAMQR